MVERLGDYLAPGRYAWSDAYHDSPHANADGCCIVCGKLTKGNGIGVILGGGGDVLILPEDDERAMEIDPGYMGWWTVGPECGKRIPARYRVKRDTP